MSCLLKYNLMVAVLMFAGVASAATEHPCDQIKTACIKAGFDTTKEKEGTGLWKHCILPIVHSTAQPADAKLALATVDTELVKSCNSKRPNWGETKTKK